MGSAKRTTSLELDNDAKRSKISLVPWKRGPSTWKGSDLTIMQPFLRMKVMAERDFKHNKYLGGKVNFDLLHNLLFKYLLPLLDLTQESLGGAKAGELNTRLSFVAMPILIRVLCKKELLYTPPALPQSQAQHIQAALKLLEELPVKLQISAEGVQEQVAGESPWHRKVKDLAESLSQLLTMGDTTAQKEDEEFEGDPEFVHYKTLEDQKDELSMVEENELEGRSEEQAFAAESITPRDKTFPSLGQGPALKEEDSPDSQLDPDFEHESHMGRWSVDLAMKIRDKRCPRKKLVKNIMDGKGAATILADSDSPGGINQLVAYSCWHLLANLKEGRYSPIYCQLFNVSKYLGAEAVLETMIKLDQHGDITEEALTEAQELQREIWKQQRPGEEFKESTLISMDYLKERLSEAQRRINLDFDVPKAEARLPGGKYIVGEFYRNEQLHAFLSVPLEQEPAASTFAFLESQLRIGLGERVTKWTWEDVKLRLEEDLERRRARLADVIVDMDKDAWRKKWVKQGQAKTMKGLAYGKERLL